VGVRENDSVVVNSYNMVNWIFNAGLETHIYICVRDKLDKVRSKEECLSYSLSVQAARGLMCFRNHMGDLPAL